MALRIERNTTVCTMWLQLVSYALFRAFLHFRRAQAMTWKTSRVCWQTVVPSITVLQKIYITFDNHGGIYFNEP
ncbi:hypothetical protein DFH08DRAFT_180361 [Mycena albidolilacea]|uniref:Uncharacterized protein n=1 Tax=Mycena albidolilacea TaxID=1033008 RepID=A0AAD7AS48_9AGAR|nr:hypothetical protein DFH08DRAFT_180361 [Mycena albidolilacea]